MRYQRTGVLLCDGPVVSTTLQGAQCTAVLHQICR